MLVAVAGWWSTGWRGAAALFSVPSDQPATLLHTRGFFCSATPLPTTGDEEFRWPTSEDAGSSTGERLGGPWQETNSKVAIIVDYAAGHAVGVKDMRKFGPLGYSDSNGNVLRSSGHQMRTATSPRSITTRRFDLRAFPKSMQDEKGLGRDGSVMWFSLLARRRSARRRTTGTRIS